MGMGRFFIVRNDEQEWGVFKQGQQSEVQNDGQGMVPSTADS